MKILAIDPGYERLGIAILEKNIHQKETVIFSDCLRTIATLPFEDRLLELGLKVESVIQEHLPTSLSIENLFVSKNQKTAMRVAEVRGMLIYLARKHNLTVKEYNPMQIKLAVTGDGKSTKDQMMKMVSILVRNIKPKALDDEYDAIAIGLAFFAYEKNLFR